MINKKIVFLLFFSFLILLFISIFTFFETSWTSNNSSQISLQNIKYITWDRYEKVISKLDNMSQDEKENILLKVSNLIKSSWNPKQKEILEELKTIIQYKITNKKYNNF